MAAKSIYILVTAAVVLVPLALFLHTFSPSPLREPKPYAGPLPSATPPKEMAIYSVVAGVNHRVAAFGYRGGSLFERRDFAMAGALVKLGATCSLIRGLAVEQFRTLPFVVRLITFYNLWRPAADQLTANAAQERFGTSRCKEFLETHREIPPARFADIFLDSVAAFSGYGSARAQEDDITLVVLDFQ